MYYSYNRCHYDWDILRYDDDNWGLDIRFILMIIFLFMLSIIAITNIFIIYYLDHYYFINFIYKNKDIYIYLYDYEIS